MGCTTVGDDCFLLKVIMQYLGKISSPDLTHGTRVQVGDGENYRLFVEAAEKEAYLGNKYLFSDIPEELFHILGTVCHMGNESVDEFQSAYFECPLERTFEHPYQNDKSKTEDEVEYQRIDAKR